MLSIARHAPKRIARPLVRSFAEVVNAPAQESQPRGGLSEERPASSKYMKTKKYSAKSPLPPGGKVPVREDHGLYAFFRRKPDANLKGEAAYEVVETPDSQQVMSGRAWEAAELRLKSFEDLHTLWYVVIRELNLLATQREETRRMGVAHSEVQVSKQKISACKKTMSRIKAVMNERRLAYLGAVELAEKEVDEYHNKVVLQQVMKEQDALIERLEEEREALLRRLQDGTSESGAGELEGATLSSTEQTTNTAEAPATEQTDADAQPVEAAAKVEPVRV